MGFLPIREMFLVLQLLFISGLGETKVCVIKQQPDPTEHFHMKWVLPYVKELLCTCTKVEFQNCTGKYHITLPLAKDYFYTDDPKPFVESESPEKLRMLLECDKDAVFWSEWGGWDSCSSSCGNGTTKRVRECVDPDSIGVPCEGDQPCESQSCSYGRCSFWSEWGDWNSCSKSCGIGTQKRVRECEDPDSTGVPCKGDPPIVFKSCSYGQCPFWSEWGEWNSCSSSCGNGTQKRVRECYNPDFIGISCEGNQPSESRNCKNDQCIEIPLGIADLSISNTQITASSYWSEGQPWKGRLNNRDGFWATDVPNPSAPWIQIEFASSVTITSLQTQGAFTTYNYWVTHLQIQTGDAESDFSYIMDGNNEPVTFSANSDGTSIVTIKLPQPICARSVRIRPTAWHQYCVLRFEVLGNRQCAPP